MNIKTIKSMAAAFVVLLSSFSAFAGDGSSTSPYTVCAASGYKLTASATISSGSVSDTGYVWKKNGNIVSGEHGATLTIAAPSTASDTLVDIHYTVTASAAVSGCTSDAQDIYVTLVPSPHLGDTTVLSNTCAWSSAGAPDTLTLSASSSAPTLPSGVSITWGSWTGNSGTSAITSTGSGTATTPSPQAAGDYVYTISTQYAGLNVGNGTACSSTKVATITINPLPIMDPLSGSSISAN